MGGWVGVEGGGHGANRTVKVNLEYGGVQPWLLGAQTLNSASLA